MRHMAGGSEVTAQALLNGTLLRSRVTFLQNELLSALRLLTLRSTLNDHPVAANPWLWQGSITLGWAPKG